MAVTLKGSTPIYEGLSKDEKPDETPINSKFFELEAKDEYDFTGKTWVKIGEES